MTDDNIRVWRDEERLPLEELERAVAGSSLDGQADDVTGNDAGEEAAFGHGPAASDRDGAGPGQQPGGHRPAARLPPVHHRPYRPGRLTLVPGLGGQPGTEGPAVGRRAPHS